MVKEAIMTVIKKIKSEEVQMRTRFNYEVDKDWMDNLIREHWKMY